MSDDCPCTPMAAFIAETEGRFNLIEEKFRNSSEQVHHMAMGMKESAAQIEQSVRAVLKIQNSIEQQNARLKAGQGQFTSHKIWLKRLTYGAAGIIAFILATHGYEAWTALTRIPQ